MAASPTAGPSTLLTQRSRALCSRSWSLAGGFLQYVRLPGYQQLLLMTSLPQSIDLATLPPPSRFGAVPLKVYGNASENDEYSTRELKTAPRLKQDLLRAHSTFLIHHAPSLSALFVKTQRVKFVALVTRYWDLFLSKWNVMLHGDPAYSVLGGIKVAACGELGVGESEKERGSAERKVLQELVGRTEGLVDLVVARYGDAPPEYKAEQAQYPGGFQGSKWLGRGKELGTEDGAIFLGVGALSLTSLQNIFHWMEDMYSWGSDAYGVHECPTSTRKRTKRTSPQNFTVDNAVRAWLRDSTKAGLAKKSGNLLATDQGAFQAGGNEGPNRSGLDNFASYLRMGYGTHWSLGGSPNAQPSSMAPQSDMTTLSSLANSTPPKENYCRHYMPRCISKPRNDVVAHFLIGLQGEMKEPGSVTLESGNSGPESRIMLRTLMVELESITQDKSEAQTTRDFGSGDHEFKLSKSDRRKGGVYPAFDSQDRNKTKRMRVVVYVSRPFIFTFLFENRTDSLAWDSMYKSLHHQLAPLRQSLILSTMYRPERPATGAIESYIYHVI